MVAGTHSGCGKTTVATGLMAAFAGAGLAVQGFKAGPDYIDPGFHTLATGRPSRNLDTRLLPLPILRNLYRRAAERAKVNVVEGVMGLFDGAGAADERGSSAHLARILGLPVVLVVDASGMGRSAAAMVTGYARFEPALKVIGVVLNRVSGPSHAALITEAVEGAAGIPVIGSLGRDDGLSLPHRHLGLVPAAEQEGLRRTLSALAGKIRESIDLERLLQLADAAGARTAERDVGEGFIEEGTPLEDAAELPHPGRPAVRIGIARDKAFSFYYADALEHLESLGAELVPFSPLSDEPLPRDLSGLYLGGGFPEVFAAELAAAGRTREEVRAFAEAGGPVIAECGGMMYLCDSILDREGRRHPMAGVLPARAEMTPTLQGLGYVEALALADNPLAARGDSIAGHLFHYSRLVVVGGGEIGGGGESCPDCFRAFCLRRPSTGTEREDGFARLGTVASYLHLHLAGIPAAARRFVEHCASFTARRAF
ncbi:MAG: cobyrinate a,c-diamide synthase [Firmicutes bacterium]|nr:cobyrinate a,c-diamide synthase [Bacillota bacterium]